jgi:hypothetical protein
VGFTRVAPQIVEHADGYRVFIADRYHLAYEVGSRTAWVAADLDGLVVRVERASLRWVAPKEGSPTAQESAVVLARIEAGVAAMGERVESL